MGERMRQPPDEQFVNIGDPAEDWIPLGAPPKILLNFRPVG